MPRRTILIILMVAIVPMFFLLAANEFSQINIFSSITTTHDYSIEEFGEDRVEYYSEPREVIKFAALGAWKIWDEHEIKLKSTIQFAINKINTKNNTHGKKIEILWYDNEGSAKKSDDLIDEIIMQEDIFGVIGPLQSSTVSVVKNKVAAAKLLHISMTQGDIDLVVPRAKSYFSATASVFAEAQAVSEWHAKKYGTNTPFILINEGDLYSSKYADTILRKFHNYDLNMIGSLIYEKSNTTGYVQRYIKNSLDFEPKVKIIIIGNAGMYLDFYKHNKELFNDIKYNDLIINQDAIKWSDFKYLPNLNKSYIILNFSYDDKFVEIMKELHYDGGIKSTIYADALVYRMVFILSNAIEQAKSNDLNTVIDYMNTHSITTPLGDVAFDEQGFVKNAPINIITAQEIYNFLKKIDIGLIE